MARDGWTKKQLVSTCSKLRNHILARDLAGGDELLDYWPYDCKARCAETRSETCPSCRKQSKHAWYMTYAHLVRMNGREEYARTLGSEEADAEFLKKLAAEPTNLRLLDGRDITIYPKGYSALKYIADHDWLCSWLAGLEQMIQTQVNEMRLTGDQLDTPVSTLDAISQELTFQMASILHVMMHPGAGLPDEPGSPPTEIQDIRPVDIARINQAFFELQLADLQLVPYIMGPQKPKSGGKRYGWSVFYTRAGKSMGKDPLWLMENRSLASLLVGMHLIAADMAEFEH